MNQKGLSQLFIILGTILVIGIVGGVYYFGKSQVFKPQSQNPTVTPPTSSSTINEITNWKTFTSQTEGFVLHYPPDWTIEDTSSGNCGHRSGTPSLIGYCRDRFTFTSPDGLGVNYAIYNDNNEDQTSCGQQSPCETQDVKTLETLDIPTLGQVYVVSYIVYNVVEHQDNYRIALHKPVNSRTIPILGKNTHPDYWIDFSLPSKTGGRFTLDVFTDTWNKNSKWTKMTYEQFYNSSSTQKAIKILKSLTY